MNQVLQFPKEKSKRVRQQQKMDGQKFFLSLSLFSFILIAVLSNEQMMRNERPIYLISDNSSHSIEQVNRAIASAQPLNMFRDVEWEHDLAKRLNEKSDRLPASTSQKVTLMDQLRYGILAGKYRMISQASDAGPKIAEIEYIDSSEVTDRPVQIPDHANFIRQYASLLPLPFDSAKLSEEKMGQEVWALHEGSDLVGQVRLKFDDTGRFLGLKVESTRSAASTLTE